MINLSQSKALVAFVRCSFYVWEFIWVLNLSLGRANQSKFISSSVWDHERWLALRFMWSWMLFWRLFRMLQTRRFKKNGPANGFQLRQGQLMCRSIFASPLVFQPPLPCFNLPMNLQSIQVRLSICWWSYLCNLLCTVWSI